MLNIYYILSNYIGRFSISWMSLVYICLFLQFSWAWCIYVSFLNVHFLLYGDTGQRWRNTNSHQIDRFFDIATSLLFADANASSATTIYSLASKVMLNIHTFVNCIPYVSRIIFVSKIMNIQFFILMWSMHFLYDDTGRVNAAGIQISHQIGMFFDIATSLLICRCECIECNHSDAKYSYLFSLCTLCFQNNIRIKDNEYSILYPNSKFHIIKTC